MQLNVRLNTPDDVEKFSSIINQCPFDVDIASNHTFIDAKSLLGIYSINLAIPFLLDAHADDEECADLKKNLAEYLV